MVRLGIDLGGTRIKCGLTENGSVIERKESGTPVKDGYEAVLDAVCKLVRALNGAGDAQEVGLAMPGLIDVEHGRVLFSNNFGWHNRNVSGDLSARLSRPVRVANDAQAAALGEALHGAGKGCARMAMLTLGTGVGGGFVRNGRLEEDTYGAMAYILGHTTVHNGNAACNCGRTGCAEAFASVSALVRGYASRTGKQKSAPEILASIDLDKDAANTYAQWLDALCELAVNTANALRPRLLVLGGGASGAANLFLPTVNKALEQYVYGFSYAPVTAVAAKLGNDAGIVGAACLNTPARTSGGSNEEHL